MAIDEATLHLLYQSRLEALREMAVADGLSKAGNVEQLRARLIAHRVLGHLDLSLEGIQEMPNKSLGDVLGWMGIKRSGSIKDRRRRLWLHLNHDPKRLNAESAAELTKDQLHELCVALELPRSGAKEKLFARVVGVLASQEGGWGKVKKSLRRPRDPAHAPAPAPTSTPAPAPAPAPAVASDEADELAAMIQASIDAVDVDEIADVLDEEGPGESLWEPEPEAEIYAPDPVPAPEPVAEVASTPAPVTIDEGAAPALLELESRMAELQSHIREFLLIGREHDANDVTAFVEDLGERGYRVQHEVVRDRIFTEVSEMARRRDAETDASAQLPGSWRERKALRRLEEVRPSLLDALEGILNKAEGDLAIARVQFEAEASEAGLDLELPGISGRVHGLFDLQVSLRESEADLDPVTARRQRALEVLYRGTQDATPEAMRTLSRFEAQMEAFERVVETIVRRSEGRFGPVEHALLIRFLERRGWDASHPEVRPRALAAGGVLAAGMGYIERDEVPHLPTALSLDPDRVSDVVDDLRGLLVDMGRAAPTETSAALGVDAALAEHAEDVAKVSSVRDKLDRADALLGRLARGTDAE